MYRYCAGFCLVLSALSCALPAAERDETFTQTIKPLLKTYCLTCHSTEKQKGEVDLERFKSLTDVKKHSKIWQNVAEQLALGEMPPKAKTQPPAAERELLANWVHGILEEIALANAGDPGPVVLRRLSNAEYTYTVRDLTGVDSLDPAREFPVDGAAGEGFTNTGQSLVMSPPLFKKYLDAGKGIAEHVVFVPDGIRFSAATTRRDRTEELLAEIREFYRTFTDAGGAAKVNLQGVVFETNGGGRLPLEKYLTATLAERNALATGQKTYEAVARERGLNAKYLETLFKTLTSKEPSFVLDGIRAKWNAAKPNDAASIATDITEWQKSLWMFSTVGNIGTQGGPKAWMEPAIPLIAKQEIKFKLPASTDGKDVTIYLAASDMGDGNENDFAVWQEPRLVAPGRPTLLLKDVHESCRQFTARRDLLVATATKSLAAAAEASAMQGKVDVEQLAAKHGVDTNVLNAWLAYLGMDYSGPPKIDGYFKEEIKNGSKYEFITGWGKPETPSIVANSSDTHVRIPGNMKPHSVAVHPSPSLMAAVGWRSPIAGVMTVEASVTRAHPECGNGIIWSLELRHGAIRQRMATGTITDANMKKVGPIEKLNVQPGDLISILIDPRNNDHSCDLTCIELVVTCGGDKPIKWSLTDDVSPDILAGNPHADRIGNKDVWHFYSEPVNGGAQTGPVIPGGSILARWQLATAPDEKAKLADELQKLLETGAAAAAKAPTPKDSPDVQLYRQLTTLGGPLLSKFGDVSKSTNSAIVKANDTNQSEWGLDPALFGKHPNGQTIDAKSLCVHAPSLLEVRLPAELVAGCEFVTTGMLHKETSAEGSVQFQVLTSKPASVGIVRSAPIVVNDTSAKRKSYESAFDDFRAVFPAALCYTKIVPTDQVITLTLFHREDEHLARLMLDDAQKARLDRLWDELHYVSQEAFLRVDVFEQVWQFATQDGNPKSLEPLREPIKQAAAAYKKQLVDTEPKHVDAVLQFADRAYRRPLTDAEREELRGLYSKLRGQELSHEEAIRLVIARVLASPAFLYRAEKPGPGTQPAAISDLELANRLSYFLWSSMPDTELRSIAETGKLHEPAVLSAQTKRMLRDPRMRRMATEFGCAWLHISGFNELSEKSDRHFPTFVGLRDSMYEETIRFFTDFFQNDGSVLGLLDADYTFVNEALAKHYGIPNVNGAEWHRVEGIKKYSRGGILGQATVLAKQSGASRTSPILRGNWIAEVLLGDKLPKPPKDVPPLPQDEAVETLTVRQLTEKHTTDARCAGCHMRIDPYGFSLESFDAIGRFRQRDLGDRPIDTHVKTMDGAQFEGLQGLRDYLLTTKRDTFLRQFCKKLVGYSLGRAVQLSDESLIRELQSTLKANDYHIGVAVEKIAQSSQFRNIRGISASNDDD